MKEEGTVVSLYDGDKKAKVRIFRRSACGECGMCAFTPENPHIDVETDNVLNAKLNDTVCLEVSSGTVLTSSLIAYSIPLLSGIIGLLISYLLDARDYIQFSVFFALVIIGYLPARLIDRQIRRNKKSVIQMVQIVSDCDKDKQE